MGFKTVAGWAPPRNHGNSEGTGNEQSDSTASHHRRTHQFPAALERGQAGTGEILPSEGVTWCRRNSLPAQLRRYQFILSGLLSMGMKASSLMVGQSTAYPMQ